MGSAPEIGTDETLTDSLREKLKRIGIHSVADALHVPFQTMLDLGMNEDEILTMEKLFFSKRVERNLLGRSKEELLRKLPIGSLALDSLLGGGVQPGVVTDFFGGSGSGKTQICFQLSVNACRDSSRTAYIDADGTFRPERVSQICENHGLDPSPVLESIYVAHPHSVHDQMRMIRDFQEIFGSSRFGLIVLDGLTKNFISEYETEQGLIKRQSKLARHLHDLATQALSLGVAIVVTNSVRMRMAGSGGQTETETGGNIVAQGLHLRIHLRRSALGCAAHLVQPQLHGPYASFKIGPKGITD